MNSGKHSLSPNLIKIAKFNSEKFGKIIKKKIYVKPHSTYPKKG